MKEREHKRYIGYSGIDDFVENASRTTWHANMDNHLGRGTRLI
jgi:hypothetical protein